ncbi:uncharacterized protein [Nicotiana tomentosiformis]|uniref:uncharacterized protein n=1 Tax=Nicotiana tomentosiformis TaxID=4098 RepID=UPI00388C4AB8
MVATEMIRHGYKPGKGLEVSLQGITEPVNSIANEKFFVMGFQATNADIKWADKHKKEGWVLPQPIPHLARSFLKPKYVEEEEAFTAEEVDDIYEAIKQMMYEAHMVQPREGTSIAEVQYMRQDAKLQNWKATPFPIRRESRSNNADLNNMTWLWSLCPDPKTLSNCEIMNQEPEYDEDEAFREINRELEQFENKPKPNLNDTEPVNLGSSEEIRETMISIHADERTRDALIQLLFEFKDVFAWSHDDMPGLSVDLVVLMDEEDAEKMAFTTPWGTYCYREIEVYVDDVIIKSRTQEDHVRDLRKFFERLRMYDLKLNAAKCAFGVPSGKLMGFIVSWRGIELDPTKIKSIRDLPPPKTKKGVMSLLGSLNYISRFIAQLTTTCEPIFKLLNKDAAIKWTDECREAFDKIKEYLSNPPVLVPPEPGRPLFLYLTVLENSFGCVLEQHDVSGKREQAMYYPSKKFTSYEAKYTLLERTCCALTWVSQKLRHYLLAYTTYLITRMDPLKYIFQKPMPTGRLAKWQILLTEFDIVYVTHTAMKAQALADNLAKNPVDDEYKPLSTYFLDEEVNSVEVIPEDTNAWKMFFDGAINTKGVGIGAILISPTSQHYPATARLYFFYTNNTAEYEAYIMGMNMAVVLDIEKLLIMGYSDLNIRQVQGEWETRDIKLIPYKQHVEDLSKRFKSVEFRYIPRFHNELADALTTLASMLPYPGNVHIDPLEIQIRERHGYCNAIEIGPDV